MATFPLPHPVAADRPAPPPAQTYSLIIKPTGKVAQLAQGEIDRLAKAYGGRSVPAHVTLMGGIVDDEQGIYDRAALLSSQLKKQKVFVTGVTIRDVKISGKPHKSIALALKGELPFGVAGALAHPTYVRSPVLPKVAHLHLSLLYSATIDEETGKGLVAELEDKVELAAPLDWLAEELLVVDTAGPNPATWPVLKAYSLQEPEELDGYEA